MAGCGCGCDGCSCGGGNSDYGGGGDGYSSSSCESSGNATHNSFISEYGKGMFFFCLFLMLTIWGAAQPLFIMDNPLAILVVFLGIIIPWCVIPHLKGRKK